MAFLNNNEPKMDGHLVDDDNDDDTFVAKMEIRPLLAANCTDYVVAHSNAALRPARHISEVFLLPHILEMMHKLGVNRLLRIQSHTWHHLVGDRGNGAMIVAAPRSGRTLSYIPPVCDVVCRAFLDAKNVKLDHLSEPPLLGPFAVILVPDLERVRYVGALCHAFLRKICNEKTYTPILTVPSTKNPVFFHRLFNGVGCLVTTPAQLVWSLKDKAEFVFFKHLKMIVYDDIDLMVPEMLTQAEEVIKQAMPMHRSHPQLVMISQSYNPSQMAKLKLMNSNPALIFGDMLEAALYGETRLRIALCPAQDKINEVLKMLQQRPPKDYRTVVFCSEDADMRRLVVLLEEKHYYSCLPYYQDANLEVREQVHGWLKETRGIILLVTDNCPELSIRHAHTLIHYSMSSSWGKFKMRHLAISGNLINKLDKDRDSSRARGLTLYSLVLLDDSNQKQLPRLVDFARKYQHVDEAIVAVAKQIRQDLALLNFNKNVLCRQIMLLGDCINNHCEERHHAGHLEQPTSLIPSSGDIKVLLVRVYSPTHFCVHLLEHLPPGRAWQSFPSPALQQMRLQLLQDDDSSSSSSNVRYWPPIAGAICLCRFDNNNSNKTRVRVLKVEPINNVNLSTLNLKVLVQAMDEDTRICSVKSGQLFKCPEELQAKPPLAIDLRLFGMVPYTGERDWSEEDRQAVELRLRNVPKDCFLQANVQFATSHTIFVRHLMAISYAKALNLHVRQFNLGQHLTETELAKSCEQAKSKILAFFEDGVNSDVLEPKEEVKLEKEQQKERNTEVQEQLKEEYKENNPPHEPAAKGRAVGLLQAGIECARRNRLAKEEQKLKEEQETKVKEAAEQPQTNQDFSQLLQCINNIAALRMEDEKEIPKDEHNQMLLAASKFLDHMENGNQTSSEGVRSRKKKDTKDSAKPPPPQRDPKNKFQSQLPPNVARPPTTYYQTLTTLELQVLLPDDGYKYNALLADNQIFFRATHPSSELRYQFNLSMSLPYSSLKDHLSGRTVYLSVKKLVAMPDPLNFHHYHRFLKPNHEKYGQLDERQEERQVEKFTEYTQQMAFKAVKYEDQDNEESADEDRNMDGIERGDNFNDYED